MSLLMNVQRLAIFAINLHISHTAQSSLLNLFRLHEVVVTVKSPTSSQPWVQLAQSFATQTITKKNGRTTGAHCSGSSKFIQMCRSAVSAVRSDSFNGVILLWATEHLHHIIWLVDTLLFAMIAATRATYNGAVGYFEEKKELKLQVNDCCWPNCWALYSRRHKPTHILTRLGIHMWTAVSSEYLTRRTVNNNTIMGIRCFQCQALLLMIFCFAVAAF